MNLYGSTETTGDVLCKVLDLQSPLPDSNASQFMPVGVPIAGSRAYVLDACEERLPENVEGELFVSGPLIADGYFGESGQGKNRSFVKDPFVSSYAPQWYYVQ